MNSLKKLPTFHDHCLFLNKMKCEKCTQKFHTLDDTETILLDLCSIMKFHKILALFSGD